MSKTYTQEFKDEIVQLHRRGQTFMELGKEFNLSPTTVCNWCRAADKRDAAKQTDPPSSPGDSDQARIRQLERELARKEEELEILGKALAFFTQRADQ